MGGEAEHCEAEDAVARLHMSDACADCLDDTGHFIAEDSRVRRLGRIECKRLEHVAEIHPRGHHLDDHLARAAGRQGKWDQPQRV